MNVTGWITHHSSLIVTLELSLVKRKTLNDLASQMGLDIILSDYSQGRLSNSMLGNAFEALIGAIYLEKGFSLTKQYVVKEILLKHLDMITLELHDDNFKSILLEWGQKNNVNVDYRLVNKYKMDKRDKFKVAVIVDGQEISVADDYSKKSAEQSASKTAIQKLNII